LKTCKPFKQLKHKCQQIYPELTNFEKRLESINMMDAGLEVDADAMDAYPNDVSSLEHTCLSIERIFLEVAYYFLQSFLLKNNHCQGRRHHIGQVQLICELA
jgi:hypothetical protein